MKRTCASLEKAMIDSFPTKHWHVLEDGRIQCDVCPRACRLKEGQRGLCFVRACEDHSIVLKTYGRSSGYCVDPVEKKPLYQFLPGSPILSFGTAGCNLSCQFCQNWDISKSREMDTLADEASPEKIARAALELGCRSVAFTYNDPVVFMEYAMDTADACREVGIRSVAVTAGYMCNDSRIDFYGHMDAANVDLKGFTESFYKKNCAGELEAVLDTLRYLKKETNVWFEITNLMIPGENDSPGEIHRMTEWIAENLGLDVPLHFTAFHPDFRMLEKPATPALSLTQARAIALSKGLRYVYTGNVHDEEGQSTFCPGCRKPVVVRDWYDIHSYRLDQKGRCVFCGEQCAGVFDGGAGNWGRKRKPVFLNNFR